MSGFLAAIKLINKSGYPDNGYLDMQTLCLAYSHMPGHSQLVCCMAISGENRLFMMIGIFAPKLPID